MTTTNTEGLKPCPFCGGAAWIAGEENNCFVTCRSNNCYVAFGEGYDRDAMPDHQFPDEASAIEAWNRRPTAQASEAAIRNAALLNDEQIKAVAKKAGLLGPVLLMYLESSNCTQNCTQSNTDKQLWLT